MKHFRYTLILLAIAMAGPKQAGAQVIDSLTGKPKDISFVIPPLVDIIDSAMKYNPDLRFRSLDITVKESGLQTQKTFWLKNVGFQADTRYGTFDNFSTMATGQSTSLINSTTRQMNYGLGVFLKLPLGDMLDRKNLLKQARTQVDQARSMEQSEKNQLRQLIIKLYQDLLLKQRLLQIKSQNYGNAKVNMEMVEKQFRNGVIPMNDYMSYSSLASAAEVDYETARSEFISAKMILEDIAGFTFMSSPSTVKNENH